MEWKNIVNLETLTFEPPADQPIDQYLYDIAPAANASVMGAKKLGWNVSILRPGQFSCPYHFHHSEEELFIVLDGKAMLRQNNKFREVQKGDLIFFANSPEGANQIYNHTDQLFKFLGLSNCNDEFEVAEYPDSKKVIVRKIRKLFEVETDVSYFKGEEDPSKFWPKEYIQPARAKTFEK
jgi:uncharacterized cupin superfamily protein